MIITIHEIQFVRQLIDKPFLLPRQQGFNLEFGSFVQHTFMQKCPQPLQYRPYSRRTDLLQSIPNCLQQLRRHLHGIFRGIAIQQDGQNLQHNQLVHDALMKQVSQKGGDGTALRLVAGLVVLAKVQNGAGHTQFADLG